MSTLTLSPISSNVNVNVSIPSIKPGSIDEKSSVTLKVAVAILLLTIKLPVVLTPPISLDDTPVMVYGIDVPSTTPLVVNVIIIFSPSSTDATFLVKS